MSVGETIRGGWDLYKRFWRHLVPIALVVYLLISLVTLALTALAGILGAIVSAFVSIAGVFWLQAALVEAVNDVRDGRADLSLGETLRRTWPRVPTVAVAGILAGFAIAVGLVLLIAPGLFLLTIWSVIVPAIVLENRPVMESFGRSRDLVRGYGWTVFGVIVMTFLLLLAVERRRRDRPEPAQRRVAALPVGCRLEHDLRAVRRRHVDAHVLPAPRPQGACRRRAAPQGAAFSE